VYRGTSTLSTNADASTSGGASTASVDISIVIPAFNEANRLLASLDDVVAFMDAHHPSYEILIVDDGSTDATAALVRERTRQTPRLRLESYPLNRGKGYAVRHGVERARGALVLFSDADLSTPIADLDKLLRAIDAGADVAIGTRAHPESDVRVRQPFYRDRAGKLFNRLVRLLLLPDLNDTQCGFKLFRRDSVAPVFRDLREERFAFDVELLYLAARRGLRIVEIPVTWVNSPDSRVRFTEGMKAFVDLLRIRWRHR
jgi:dolichyl-phosphate beta-glucosyltransferase